MGTVKKIGIPRLGHIIIDVIPFEHCSQCNYLMPLNKFSKKSEAWDGKRVRGGIEINAP